MRRVLLTSLFAVVTLLGVSPVEAQISISASSLAGTQYEAYRGVLTASGGAAPYTWSVASSTQFTLPEGTTLSSSAGTITGVPKGSGLYTVTVQVSDANGKTASSAIAIPIAGNQHLNGCTYFPADNVWRQRIDGLPVHPQSAIWNSYYHNARLHPDFGQFYGIPFTVTSGAQAPLKITVDGYASESDFGTGTAGPQAVPFPPDAPIEGTNTASLDSDRHVLSIDTSTCTLYELYQGRLPAWTATSTAMFDLNSNQLRPAGWTSSDAAGLPVTPGLVAYDEVASGEIAHAVRMTMNHTTASYLWPARHKAGLSAKLYPPMGARIRLRDSSSVNARIARLSPTNRIIATALQRYGAFIADNGSSGFISGVPDARWNDDDLVNLWASSSAVATTLSTTSDVSSGTFLPFQNVSTLRAGMWVQCHTACKGIGVLGTAGPHPVIATVAQGGIKLSQPLIALVPAGTQIDFVDPDQSCAAGPGFCLNDFDYVDESALQIGADSGATRPVITTASLPGGTPGQHYSVPINHTGGLPPFTCAMFRGSLPAGLSLDAAACTVSGTFSNAGMTEFTVTVTDAAGRFDAARYSMGYSAHRALPLRPPPTH